MSCQLKPYTVLQCYDSSGTQRTPLFRKTIEAIMAICNRKGDRMAWESVKMSRGKALVNHGGSKSEFQHVTLQNSIKIGS